MKLSGPAGPASDPRMPRFLLWLVSDSRVQFATGRMHAAGGPRAEEAIIFWIDLVIVLFITLAISLVLAVIPGGRYGGRRIELVWLFVLLFFSTWAMGMWFQPLGPPLWGGNLFAFVFVAVMLVLLIVAVAGFMGPSNGSRPASGRAVGPQHPDDMEPAANVPGIVLSIYFWLLLLTALLAIIFRYTWG